ncbi:MAG: hypothetical protein Q9211_006658 [Gyalolechia sp. 1 TL-2023]
MVLFGKQIENAILGRGLVRYMDEKDQWDAARQRGLTRRQYQSMMPNNIQWAPIPPPPRVSRASMPYDHLRPSPTNVCQYCRRTLSMQHAMMHNDYHPNCPAEQHHRQWPQGRRVHGPTPGRRGLRYHRDYNQLSGEDDDNNTYDDGGDEPGEDDESDPDDDNGYDDDRTDFSRRSYPRHRPARRRPVRRGHGPHALLPPQRDYRMGVGMPPGYGYDNLYAMDGEHREGNPYGYSDNGTTISW